MLKLVDTSQGLGYSEVYTTAKLSKTMDKIADYFLAKHFVDVVLVAGEYLLFYLPIFIIQ